MPCTTQVLNASDYSPRLGRARNRFAERLRGTDVIFRGDFDSFDLTRKSIAVIGTRTPSAYGYRSVRQIVSALRDFHVNVISGGALGIDAEAHRAALDCGLPTQAWLVGPIARPGPHTNTELFERIAGTPGCGLVVPACLEPSPERRIDPKDWVLRNQWLVAAADAIIVIEGKLRSGTWSSVSASQNTGIPVHILPGPIDSAQSAGTNSMISKGWGHCILSVESLVDALIEDLGRASYNKERGQMSLPLGGPKGPEAGGQVVEFLRELLRSSPEGWELRSLGSKALQKGFGAVEFQEAVSLLLSLDEARIAGDRFEGKGSL